MKTSSNNIRDINQSKNDKINRILEQFPIFEFFYNVDGKKEIYLKEKRIHSAKFNVMKFSNHVELNSDNWYASEDRCTLQLMDDGGSGLISIRSLNKLTDDVCVELYKYNIDIIDSSGSSNPFVYDREAIMRRWTINNILHEGN